MTGANMICELVDAGLKVGITAVSHKVIVNLMESVMKQAAERGQPLRAVHKQSGQYEGSWNIERVNMNSQLTDSALLLSGTTSSVAGSSINAM